MRRLLWATVCLVVLAAHASAFNCTNQPAGTQRWYFNTGAQHVGDASHVTNGRVFFAVDSGNSTFFALDAETGALVWQRIFPKEYNVREKMPSTLGDVVFVVPGLGQVWALDQATGATVWTFQSDLQSGWTSNPQVDEGSGMVVTSSLTTLYGLDGKSGAVIWQQPLINTNLGTGSTLWTADGVVYIAADAALHAFDVVSGSELWQAPWGQEVTGAASAAPCRARMNSPMLVAILVGGVRSNSLLGFDSITGAPAFNFTLPDTVDVPNPYVRGAGTDWRVCVCGGLGVCALVPICCISLCQGLCHAQPVGLWHGLC